ncbi:MAG: CvpA family protein [Porphyromonadaceae bacterium]|nr:CvpA family protein [Porphyromonadaceae bacterium]
MNQLDLFLGGVLLLFALGGLFGGAVRRVVQVAALIIAFREAWRVAPYIEQVLGGGDGSSLSGWGFILPLLSFAVVYTLIRLVGGWFGSLAKGPVLGVLDRLVGLVLGLLVGIYLLGYGCLLYEGIFPTQPYTEDSTQPPSARQSSLLYPRLLHSVEDIRQVRQLLFPSDSTGQEGAQPTSQPVEP